ncbi:unnamed protein product [Notodromas monacha]|uniref:Mannosyltransferase n=1 Tax=Notodromas monacha TaxID=399045 RepID=A0A7R9BU47_9CRUS|nr:unnamed protein product [Notodromas monacha]CAG0921788.1 unnamed protein product [Notodromas monacha]
MHYRSYWIPAIWKETALKVERRVDYVMMASFLFPVLILTLFKHQEPRFLIPVLFPLVYVAHDKFFKPGVLSKVLLGSWIVSNVLLTYFYGVMHQAGIPPMLIYVSRNLQRTGQGLHLISTYSYSMPQFLLANPRGSGFPIHTYDLGSTDLYQVIEFACGFHDALPALVAMPGSMTERHLVSGNGTCADSGLWKVASSVSRKYGVVGHPGVQFCRQASFSPHLTTEFLPVISNVTFSEVFRAVEQLRLDLFLIKCS